VCCTVGGRSFNCSALGFAAWANACSPQRAATMHAANKDLTLRILPPIRLMDGSFDERDDEGPAPRRSRLGIKLKLESYLPTMMIVKEPGIAAPRPAPRPPDAGGGEPAGGGGGGGPTSDAIANRRPVLLSNAIVRAPFDGHV